MAKRTRSPDYPGIGLKEAVEKARLLHEKIGQHPTTREVVATGMGYRGLSGASASAISALRKYGLLDGRGEEIHVSDRAMAILHPHSDEERNQALRDAALEPALFRELHEKFPGDRDSDELLKNYLMRNGYTTQAVSPIISSYRETKEFVRGTLDGYDSGPAIEEGPEPMSRIDPQQPSAGKPQQMRPATGDSVGDVKIGEMGFAGVGFVRIMASPTLSTRKALSMAKRVIEMMEEELEEQASAPPPVNEGEGNDTEQNA